MTDSSVPALTILAVFFSVTAACAQSAGPVEAVGPDGAVVQPIVQPMPLSPVQRSTLYNTASRERIHADAGEITAVVGTPVPPSPASGNLPEVLMLGDDSGSALKYAMVEDDVVVVDPIRMRVVDVIHSGVGR